MSTRVAALLLAIFGMLLPRVAQSSEAITMPPAAIIEFGEWPLESADPDAVEAMFRHSIKQTRERFGEKLDFVCLAYAYGQPTQDYIQRFSDLGVIIKGRYSCSPDYIDQQFAVLIDLAEIRCSSRRCTAITGLSFGHTIEKSVWIWAEKSDEAWMVAKVAPR